MLSDVCDVVTGECECSEGVGGRECDFCLHGYFDYSLTDGCSSESGERERERERGGGIFLILCFPQAVSVVWVQ